MLPGCYLLWHDQRSIVYVSFYLEGLATPEGPATPGKLYSKLMFLASFLSQAASLKSFKKQKIYDFNRLFYSSNSYSAKTLFDQQKIRIEVKFPIEDLTEIQDISYYHSKADKVFFMPFCFNHTFACSFLLENGLKIGKQLFKTQ